MALDKVLKIYDENGNPVDYDILASDVKFLPDGKDLPTKLTEMEDAIEDAAEGGGYTPPQGGIPKTDLAPSVQTSLGLADTALQPADKTQLQNAINSLQSALDTLIGSGNVQGAIDTFNEVKAFLDGIDTDDPTLANQLQSLSSAISALQTALAGKISGIKANGASDTLPVDQNGVVELPPAGSTISPATATPSMDGTAAVGSSAKYAREDHVHPKDTSKLSKSDVSVETQGDGTVDINVKDDTYKINLNHTHENMAKLVVCEESDLPSTLEMDTIYAQVDDAEEPGEIQKLWIAGLEFVGGGGAPDETPKLITPTYSTTIDFGGESSKTLSVRGKNLSEALTLSVTGDFTVTASGSSVSSISAADAMAGIILTLTKGSNYTTGTLRIYSSEVDTSVSLLRDTALPAEYTALTAVRVQSVMLDPGIKAEGSSWRVKARTTSSNTPQVLICKGNSAGGQFFGIVSVGGNVYWGLSIAEGCYFTDINIAETIEAVISFGADSTATIGGETITRPDTQMTNLNTHLFGVGTNAQYPFSGFVYEVECLSGGVFHALPAKRKSDGAVGFYDVENNQFYTNSNFSEN